jgi:hypothetical protein
MAILKALTVVCASFMITPFLAIPYDQPVTQTTPQWLQAGTVKLFKGSVIYKSETGFPAFMMNDVVTAENQAVAALSGPLS